MVSISYQSLKNVNNKNPQNANFLTKIVIVIRDASIRYSGSVSAPIRSFSVDWVSVRRDRSKSDVVRILFCAVVRPHENHINIIKHHKVSMHYMSSVQAVP